ncbi:MAG: ATP-grasp fold amidoligase family protein [Rhodanobacteraceae bacterium]
MRSNSIPAAHPRPTRERIVRLALRLAVRTADLIDGVPTARLDPLYLALRHLETFRRWPNMRHPATFNEHILAYKLSNPGNELMSRLADKIAVKEYVANRIGPQYLIPTLWYGNAAEGIPFADLACAPHVIKSAFGSSQNIFIRQPDDFDKNEVVRTVNEWMHEAYGRRMREYQYARIPRRILVEPLVLVDGHVPEDYKFYAFNGTVRLVQVDTDRFGRHTRTLFDVDWRAQDFAYVYPRPALDPARPAQLDRMIEVAQSLTPGVEFVRVDLYDLRTRIAFGELTFTPEGGDGKFYPDGADLEVGRYWACARSREEATDQSPVHPSTHSEPVPPRSKPGANR